MNSLISLSHYAVLIALAVFFLCVGKACFQSKNAKTLLFVLISTDVIFLFLNAAVKGNFHIDYDRGYPEMFGYFKELFSGAILIWIGVKTRSPIILIIFVMIILAFMDDVFMFHEGIGLQLSQTLNLSGSVDGEGIRGRDIGEVIYILSVGLFFLGLSAIFYFREKSSWCRDTVHGVALIMMTLVFFSVGMDTADHLLKSTHWRHLFGLADDFGEMLGLSAFLAFCIDRLRSYFVLAKNKLL